MTNDIVFEIVDPLVILVKDVSNVEFHNSPENHYAFTYKGDKYNVSDRVDQENFNILYNGNPYDVLRLTKSIIINEHQIMSINKAKHITADFELVSDTPEHYLIFINYSDTSRDGSYRIYKQLDKINYDKCEQFVEKRKQHNKTRIDADKVAATVAAATNT
jgi:hypothetical protein